MERPDRELLTLTAIARQLGVPESTLRYYRERFRMFVPYKGHGRNRRYPPEAAEVFRTIAEMFAERKSAAEIAQRLQGLVTPTIDVAAGGRNGFAAVAAGQALGGHEVSANRVAAGMPTGAMPGMGGGLWGEGGPAGHAALAVMPGPVGEAGARLAAMAGQELRAAVQQVASGLEAVTEAQVQTNQRLDKIIQLLEDPASIARRRMAERRASFEERLQRRMAATAQFQADGTGPDAGPGGQEEAAAGTKQAARRRWWAFWRRRR